MVFILYYSNIIVIVDMDILNGWALWMILVRKLGNVDG
jgi:hypothetical protein